MSIRPDQRWAAPQALGRRLLEPHSAPGQAQRMRALLRDFAERAGTGRLAVRLPPGAPIHEVARGEGHFHLAPELFLQVSGWTRFSLPNGTLHLPAGEALLLPARLLHAERVGAVSTRPDDAFCNLVIYAEGATLSCHLAHEMARGRPGILHLEASHHPQAARIPDWLADAVHLGRASDDAAWAPEATVQRRALVATTLVGVLRALDDPAERPEPALVARVRVLIQNQLGDQDLSVRRLAEQSGCTPDHLSHLFSRTTGEHLASFIVRRRMERATHLLRDSTMAGKEIAWACGYATQSYFVRSFRERFGVTPKVWRSRG